MAFCRMAGLVCVLALARVGLGVTLSLPDDCRAAVPAQLGEEKLDWKPLLRNVEDALDWLRRPGTMLDRSQADEIAVGTFLGSLSARFASEEFFAAMCGNSGGTAETPSDEPWPPRDVRLTVPSGEANGHEAAAEVGREAATEPVASGTTPQLLPAVEADKGRLTAVRPSGTGSSPMLAPCLAALAGAALLGVLAMWVVRRAEREELGEPVSTEAGRW